MTITMTFTMKMAKDATKKVKVTKDEIRKEEMRIRMEKRIQRREELFWQKNKNRDPLDILQDLMSQD